MPILKIRGGLTFWTGTVPLKENPVFATGERSCFFTQNTKSQDWSVVGGSNLFWHTLWTLPALFGVRTPPKSICTHAGTRLKNFDENTTFLRPTMVSAPYGVSNIKIVKNLPIKVHSPQKSIYSTPIHLKLIIRPKL